MVKTSKNITYVHMWLTANGVLKCVISGFRREVAECRPLLGYCAASSDNFLPTFRDNLSAPSYGSTNDHYSRVVTQKTAVK
jgi:hypothetical protein